MTLGLKRAGFRVIGAVDNDALSLESYRLNHPEVTVWNKNIRLLSVYDVMRTLGLEPGTLDLLAGCPPCQGFSTTRTLNGSRVIYDGRNDLVWDFFRFVKQLRPKAVLLENVPALASDTRFKRLCMLLGYLGYRWRHKILNAADYGVPQRRRRVFLLAGRNNLVRFPKRLRKRMTVRDAIDHLPEPGASGDPLHDVMEKRSERIMNMIRNIPKDGGSRVALGRDTQLACHRRCDGFKDVYGRMAWENVAPTITAGCVNPSKGRFLHPVSDRAITLREAALLQSFPGDYRFALTRGKLAAASLIGNAMPPRMMEKIGAAVRKTLDNNPAW